MGDGPEETCLRRLGDELGIAARTQFCGLRDDVASLLREADIFVHPATWAEAFGWTIAEAMASGCAVIATNVGAIPELVEHGRSGMLVPPADPIALAHAMTRLAGDEALRLELGRNARARAEERFGLARSASAWRGALGCTWTGSSTSRATRAVKTGGVGLPIRILNYGVDWEWDGRPASARPPEPEDSRTPALHRSTRLARIR